MNNLYVYEPQQKLGEGCVQVKPDLASQVIY